MDISNKPGTDDPEKLPPSIVVGDMIKNSMEEISALMYVIEHPTGGKASKKKFPNHMRRRAMSHDIRRVPLRLRETYLALREKSNTREGKQKVPRAKYRRRPKQLVKEYNRRQKIYRWLETHIWHAKRFSMAAKWGYKIPLRPSDKSFRACYRATANHCLIQDISYYNCFEITGKVNDIIKGLELHINNGTALKMSLNGNKESDLFMYKNNSYPKGAIGEVKFIWKPPEGEQEEDKSVWLWVHPSFVEELLEEFIKTFNLDLAGEDKVMEVDTDIELEKIPPKNRNVIKYVNKTNNLKLSLLNLNRFRLLGPLSQAIISKSLIPLELNGRTISDWVTNYYNADDKIRSLKCQTDVWNAMKYYTTPAQLTPRIVIPLTIYDPRFTMPAHKTKALNDEDEFPSDEKRLNPNELSNPIWSYELRNQITKEKYSTKQVNELRSNKLVPGIEVEQNNQENINNPAFPILAIQSPGSQFSNKRLGYGCGWDLICPAGYAMPLWLSLVMAGGRAGGLRESESFLREANIFGPFAPDTKAGCDDEQFKRTEATDKYFRLPPAKRHNYLTLGIPTPFHCPWEILTKDWSNVTEFYVLRDRSALKELQQSLNSGFPDPTKFPVGALLGVSITMEGKGLLEANALICLPTESDLSSGRPPVENKHLDPNKETRNESVNAHKSFLKFLARKRKKDRLKKKEGEEVEEGKYSSEKAILEQSNKIKALWLSECNTIRHHCSRQIFGFITNGDFCFTEAVSSGVGYVSLEGFRELVNLKSKCRVIIRTTNTLQYRFAKLKIVIN